MTKDQDRHLIATALGYYARATDPEAKTVAAAIEIYSAIEFRNDVDGQLAFKRGWDAANEAITKRIEPDYSELRQLVDELKRLVAHLCRDRAEDRDAAHGRAQPHRAVPELRAHAPRYFDHSSPIDAKWRSIDNRDGPQWSTKKFDYTNPFVSAEDVHKVRAIEAAYRRQNYNAHKEQVLVPDASCPHGVRFVDLEPGPGPYSWSKPKTATQAAEEQERHFRRQAALEGMTYMDLSLSDDELAAARERALLRRAQEAELTVLDQRDRLDVKITGVEEDGSVTGVADFPVPADARVSFERDLGDAAIAAISSLENISINHPPVRGKPYRWQAYSLHGYGGGGAAPGESPKGGSGGGGGSPDGKVGVAVAGPGGGYGGGGGGGGGFDCLSADGKINLTWKNSFMTATPEALDHWVAKLNIPERAPYEGDESVRLRLISKLNSNTFNRGMLLGPKVPMIPIPLYDDDYLVMAESDGHVIHDEHGEPMCYPTREECQAACDRVKATLGLACSVLDISLPPIDDDDDDG